MGPSVPRLTKGFSEAMVFTQVSAWKVNSANFALTEFAEVRMLRILSLTAFACSAKRLWWRRLLLWLTDSEHRENHHRGSGKERRA